MEYRVISTDDHIIEAPDAFDRLPEQFRDRQPRILRGPDGGDGWSFDGSPPKSTFGLNAVAGRAVEDYKESGLTLEEIMPGNYEGSAHLKDMDIDGVDAATLYPMATLEAFVLDDREFGLACIRAYNDWLLDEFCGADPKRLIGLPIVSVDDGESAMLDEARRVIEKGARGIFLPYFAERGYYDPWYDPLWTLLEESAVAATIHRTMGGTGPAAESTMGSVGPKARPGLNVAGIVERFFSGVTPLTRMIFTGVFERHPKLRFVDAEVNGGWVPFWIQMMEQEYERQKHWANLPLTESPSASVGRNIFVTVLDDFVGFEMAKSDEILARCIMFSSDYPHSTTLWPRSQEYIARLTVDMDEPRKRAVLADNAIRAFSLTN